MGITSRLCTIQLINIHMIIFSSNIIKKCEVEKLQKSLTRVTRLHDILTTSVNQYVNICVFVKVNIQASYTNLHEKPSFTKIQKLTYTLSVVMQSCNRVGHFFYSVYTSLNIPQKINRSRVASDINYCI